MGQFLKPSSLVAITGELGSGKTQLVKGVARGLGVDRRYHVSSPSFVLIKEYPGRIPLYHFDLYRLTEVGDLDELGLEEYFFGQGVSVIEWADRAESFIPSRHIWIDIHWTGPNQRQLMIKAVGKQNIDAVEAALREMNRGIP